MNPCLPAGLYEGAKNTDEYLDQLTLARILLKNPKISTQEAQDMVINMKQGKRAPGAVHDGLSEEVIFTSKSALPKVDLHKVFQNPQAWNVLSEAEKADLQRDLGPEAFEPDGTISQEFLKHNAHWAGSIRQFSTDVEAGRYEQRFAEEASAAMEARASGAFDTYKEAQVEEFYGQKQKVDRNVLAGDAASVSLSDIIKDNVFAIGDIWSYERAFGRGTMAYVVGKECIVTSVDRHAGTITVTIPPGQHKFMQTNSHNTTNVDRHTGNVTVTIPAGQRKSVPPDPHSTTDDEGSLSEINKVVEVIGDHITKPLTEVNDESWVGHDAGKASNDKEEPPQGTENETMAGEKVYHDTQANLKTSTFKANDEKLPVPRSTRSSLKRTIIHAEDSKGDTDKNNTEVPEGSNVRATKRTKTAVRGSEAGKSTDQIQPPDTLTFSTASELEKGILDVDGRPQKPRINGWRTFRCIRNNQDIGSLFDLREAHYNKHSSKS